MKIMSANRIASDGTPRFAASHLGLFCLPMSHKKDARLIWVKSFITLIIKLIAVNYEFINYVIIKFDVLVIISNKQDHKTQHRSRHSLKGTYIIQQVSSNCFCRRNF